MAQQYPNGGRGHGGRGSSLGGRGGGGRGGGGPGPSQHQQQPYNPNYSASGGGGRGGPRPVGSGTMGAWQPAQPTSLQQAAGYPGVPPPPPPQSSQQGQSRSGSVPSIPGGFVPAPSTMPPYYNPYVPPGVPYAPNADPNRWQGQPAYAQTAGIPQQRGVFYPPPNGPPMVTSVPPGPIPQSQMPQPPAPREKKPLVITDKQGNVIDFSKKPVASSLQSAAAASAPKPASVDHGEKLRKAAMERLKGQDTSKSKEAEEKAKKDAETQASEDKNAAEEKAKQEADNIAKKEAEEKARIEAEEKAKLEAEEKAKLEAEEKVKLEAEEKAKLEAEVNAKYEAQEKARVEAEEQKAKKEAEEKSKMEAEEEKVRQELEVKAKIEAEGKNEKGDNGSSSLAVAVTRENNLASSLATVVPAAKRIVIPKKELLSYQHDPQCKIRPIGLPDMTVVRVEKPAGGPGERNISGGGGGRGAGQNRRDSEKGGNWNQPARRHSQQEKGQERVGGDWKRGVRQPEPQPSRQQNPQRGRGDRGVRNDRGHHQQPFYDGPVAPLIKSENHWRPRKNTSALVVAEKKVKALLNKMTKEKFNSLSEQMLEMPISSSEILTMMIDNVYDKAIDEPRFGDMYADLCVRLSQSVQGNEFVHIIESDEEPPTEEDAGAPVAGESSSHTVYRWSNDISTTDSEIVGPLPSPEACIEAAHNENEHQPVERGDMELDLVKVTIKRSIFIKIMKQKSKIEGEKDQYYTVYFPTYEAEELGQSLSPIFLSRIECESDSMKKNSFKRSLLNKCEEEFNKQDIYEGWKKEKKEYEESQSKFSEAERREKEEELSFRRIRIKKQMLGNVQFIGQLYKKGLLKEKIMRYCIASLLLLEENKEIKGKNPEYTDPGKVEQIDEEDHEAICSLFTTIGSTIDKPHASEFMKLCFTKIKSLSVHKSLPSRSRFMYKDLIELKENNWVPRRKEEKAKTIAEIRMDVEAEERKQAQESARAGRGGDFRTSGGRGGAGTDYRASNRPVPGTSSVRSRQPKPTIDDEGFTVIGTKTGSAKPLVTRSVPPRISPTTSSTTKFQALDDEKEAPAQSTVAPLDDEKMGRLIKRMRNDFMSDGGNVNELILTFDEILGTPGYGHKVVQKNVDHMFECRDNERLAIVGMLIALCEKGKLTKDEVQNGMMDTIEFIDSMILDCPRAFEYLGELLGAMLKVKVIDIRWLCDQLDKTKADPTTSAPEKILLFSLVSLKKLAGQDAVKSAIDEKRILSLLGDEKWISIQNQL